MIHRKKINLGFGLALATFVVIGAVSCWSVTELNRTIVAFENLLAFALVSLAVFLINSDITQRKRSEETLQTTKNELEIKIEERTAELRKANEQLQAEIAERKRAEQALKKLNEDFECQAAQLEAVNKELEAFSCSVSHDLRAPLCHIGGYVELLQRNVSPLDEKSGRYLKMISESGKRMENLIDNLLAFSRVGRAKMQKAVVSLEQLVKEVIHDFWEEAHRRNIAWEIGRLPEVYGDRSMLRLVLVNLISNALKFTRARAQAEIKIGCTSGKENEIVFFIRDNGAGLDMRYADKLFGVFQRLHSADKFEGIGMGLAHVRRIIHRHGGRTWAEGSVDGGATFYFSLLNHREDK